MDPLDDYFEYAMDLNEQQRADLLARLRDEDPGLAERLEHALTQMVRNPDFMCQSAPAPRAAGEQDRVHAVTVRVGDLERATAWYVEHFVCRLVARDERRAVLAFGDVQVQLRLADDEPPPLTIVSPDVAALGPSTRRPDGVRALTLTDPWGNVIEVVDRPR
ncbi:MAG: hypothetical protein KAI24_20065 [Planctomycetes bacterium]|nr:hypothetical protein [Planctomycetota bacterium]